MTQQLEDLATAAAGFVSGAARALAGIGVDRTPDEPRMARGVSWRQRAGGVRLLIDGRPFPWYTAPGDRRWRIEPDPDNRLMRYLVVHIPLDPQGDG